MLRTSADLVVDVVDHLEDGIWLLDPGDARIQDLSLAGHAQIGSSPGQELVVSFRDVLFPAQSIEGWRLLLDQVPASGAHALTVRIRAADGGLLPVQLTLSRTRTRTTRPGAWAEDQPAPRDMVLAVTRDLSERATANERIAAEHDLLDRTLDAVENGVAIIDRDGRVEHANDAFARLVDLHHDRIVDRSVYDAPWGWLDADGEPIHSESTPPVVTMRTGEPSDAALVQLRGTGLDRPTEELVTVRVHCEPLLDLRGEPNGAVLALTDLTEAQRWKALHHRRESMDSLTGLRSRSYITEHIAAAVDAATETEARVGVLHVDLDAFRSVNDTFGTTFGDRVLRVVADRLRDLSDRHVEVGRIGVDEFLVVTSGSGASLAFDTRLRRLAEEIQRRTEQPLTIEGLELRLTASVGISRSPANAGDGPALLRAADTALAAGRREGRHQLRFYERSLDERTRTGLALDRDLRLAAAQRTLEVHYQPIIDLRTGEVAAAEALVRWNHPEHGPIPPSVFIPTAEATGAISAVSDMVVTTVAEDVAGWNREDLLPVGARIAVNISSTEFEQRGFVDRIASTLANAGVSPSRLELEITETLLMRDMETTAERLTQLDALGFLVALDDFGTGYSSLSYLHTLPLHTLKVDRCFVGELGNGRSETITRAILSLAQGLGIGTVGEGVETDEQRKFLLEAGCDLVQGFFYAPALPRPAFEKFLRDHAERRRTVDLQPV